MAVVERAGEEWTMGDGFDVRKIDEINNESNDAEMSCDA